LVLSGSTLAEAVPSDVTLLSPAPMGAGGPAKLLLYPRSLGGEVSVLSYRGLEFALRWFSKTTCTIRHVFLEPK